MIMMSRDCSSSSLALALLLGVVQLVLILPNGSQGFHTPPLPHRQQQQEQHRLNQRKIAPFSSSSSCLLLRTEPSVGILRSTTDQGDDTPASSDAAALEQAQPQPRLEQQEDPTIAEERPVEFPVGSHVELLYALGVNLARQLGDVRPLVETDVELANLGRGVLDCILGRLSEEQQKELLQRRVQDLNELVSTRAARIQEVLAEAGRTMLREMAATEGAITLQEASQGVVVHVLERGEEGSVRPTRSSSVKIHYHGTLADGTTFDSTRGGEPVILPLASVIPGWRDAVLKLHEGDTAMVGIPPEHAYGVKGTPDGRIPPNSTIFFKVQLLEVLSAGIGGTPTLYGSNGQKLGGTGSPANSSATASSSSGLLGADGRPM
jgi:FKBP-type peptidyl-prolyl cis-trans isomerase